VLELTVMQLAYNFDVSAQYPIFLLVLWALGACMVILAALVWLPMPMLTAVSIATIVLHHLLDGIDARSLGTYAPLWNLLHQIGAFPFAGRIFIAAYSLVPWLAVMSLGFCFGPVFAKPPGARQRVLLAAGTAATIAFVVVRGLNVYGDPASWSVQSSATFTALSFLNATKYPPSLVFLLMTLGPSLMLLAWFDRLPFARTNPLIVFGRVPLFYFVLHFFVAHALAVLAAVFTYGSAAWSFMFQPVPSMGAPVQSFPVDFGYQLWITYVMWLLVVVALYPVCRWYANLKAESRSKWLAYL
jgi:uncharacterized membrane protein